MTTLFNSNKASKKFSDPSDTYANQRQLYLSFFHIASQKSVAFKAFVKDYGESFTSDWNSEPVFGRMDPIMTFRNTTRKINVSWDIPAASLMEAKQNMRNCNLLSEFMYPGYTLQGLANTLAKPPLMRVRFANLIRGVGDSPEAEIGGLLVAVGSLSVTPSFDDGAGFFDPAAATLYPKLITITCDFSALHEHPMGWDEGDKIFGYGEWFPWGLEGERQAVTDPATIKQVMDEGPPAPPADPPIPRSDEEQEAAEQIADDEAAGDAAPTIDEMRDAAIDEEYEEMIAGLNETDTEEGQRADDIRVYMAIEEARLRQEEEARRAAEELRAREAMQPINEEVAQTLDDINEQNALTNQELDDIRVHMAIEEQNRIREREQHWEEQAALNRLAHLRDEEGNPVRANDGAVWDELQRMGEETRQNLDERNRQAQQDRWQREQERMRLSRGYDTEGNPIMANDGATQEELQRMGEETRQNLEERYREQHFAREEREREQWLLSRGYDAEGNPLGTLSEGESLRMRIESEHERQEPGVPHLGGQSLEQLINYYRTVGFNEEQIYFLLTEGGGA